MTLDDPTPTGDQYDFAAIEVPPAALAPPDTTPPQHPRSPDRWTKTRKPLFGSRPILRVILTP